MKHFDCICGHTEEEHSDVEPHPCLVCKPEHKDYCQSFLEYETGGSERKFTSS